MEKLICSPLSDDRGLCVAKNTKCILTNDNNDANINAEEVWRVIRWNEKTKTMLLDTAMIMGGLLATGLLLWIIYEILASAAFLPAIMVLGMMGPPY